MATITIELDKEAALKLLEWVPLAERETALAQLNAAEALPRARLEDYFDFLAPDDIRVKGTRIGIESILLEHLHRTKTPEQIKEMLDSVSLEQVYATILYYLRNKEKVTAYLNEFLEYTRQAQQRQAASPPPAAGRIRQFVAEREKARAQLSA